MIIIQSYRNGINTIILKEVKEPNSNNFATDCIIKQRWVAMLLPAKRKYLQNCKSQFFPLENAHNMPVSKLLLVNTHELTDTVEDYLKPPNEEILKLYLNSSEKHNFHLILPGQGQSLIFLIVPEHISFPLKQTSKFSTVFCVYVF